jgi:hypothetical protein
MKPAAVLNQGTLPGNWHCEKQGVEPAVIETLANVAARRKDKPLSRIRNRCELVGRAVPLFGCHSAL